jgi:hypothetical protein
MEPRTYVRGNSLHVRWQSRLVEPPPAKARSDGSASTSPFSASASFCSASLDITSGAAHHRNKFHLRRVRPHQQPAPDDRRKGVQKRRRQLWLLRSDFPPKCDIQQFDACQRARCFADFVHRSRFGVTSVRALAVSGFEMAIRHVRFCDSAI